ncbi:MAG: PfkB family carbohydrate kinase, partial [Mobilitalea sp.]
DIMLDQYDICYKIKEQNNVDICSYEKTEYMPGGAANVAQCFNLNGHISYLFGYIGRDPNSLQLLQLLHGVRKDYISEVNIPTTLKKRIVINDKIICRIDTEKLNHVRRANSENKLLDHNWKFSAVVISDYQKGALNSKFISKLIKKARAYDIPVFVDTKCKFLKCFQYAYAVVITLQELNYAEECSFTSILEIQSFGFECLRKYKFNNLIIKNNAEGSVLFSESLSAALYTCDEADEVCAIGAGDVYLSTFCIALCEGSSIELAFKTANKAASLSIQYQYTSTLQKNIRKEFMII